MEPFTPEQQAAIAKVIAQEVAQAVAGERVAFAQALDTLRAELEAPGPTLGAWIKGALQSWTVWAGGTVVLLPELLNAIAPLVTEQWGPAVWQRVLQLVGVAMILLRAKTTDSLTAKGT